MSKVALSGNVLGTGTVTLASPNTNSTVTLNLPATTGTVLIQDGTNTTTVVNLTATGTVNVGGGNISPQTGFKNRIINGAMTIDQRNNGALVAGASGDIYSADRFLTGVFGGGTGRISAQQSSTVPTSAGFVKSVINTVTTADASPSASFGYCFQHKIEGFNVADLGWGASGAATVTLSFWVRNSLTGTYVITLSNLGNARAYSATYAISSANTWELKTITFPGDISGTWNTGNGQGIQLTWGLGGGTDRQAAAVGSWGTGAGGGGTNAVTDASGCVDWIATSGATFYITGVQLEKGSVATPFEFRSIGTELGLCQRYYEIISNGDISGGAFSASNLFAGVRFAVEKRASPTVASVLNGTWVGNGNLGAISSVAFDGISIRGCRMDSFSFAGTVTQGYAYNFRNFDWRISAEL